MTRSQRTGSDEANGAPESTIPVAGRRRFLQSVGGGVVATSIGASLAGRGRAESGDGIPTPWLDRVGREIRDPNGNRVVLRGVSTDAPSRVNGRNGRNLTDLIDMATDASNGWYARCIRLPCTPSTGMGASEWKRYIEDHLRPAVEKCFENGVYCIIGYDRSSTYHDPETDRAVREFWKHVAPAFSDYSNVLFELFCDPKVQSGRPDGDQRTWDRWQECAQPWVDRIREHAPRNLILIGTPGKLPWPIYAPENEFEGNNVVYSGQVYRRADQFSWYKVPNIGDSVPLFVTEWGYQNAGTVDYPVRGTKDSLGDPFRQWLENQDNVHTTASYFSRERVPRMFDDEWNLLGGQDYEGTFVKEHLARHRNEDLPTGSGSRGGGSGDVVDVPDSRVGSGRRTEVESIEKNASHVYLHRVESDTTELKIVLDGAGPADLDVFVTHDGTEPTHEWYDQKSTVEGHDQTITVGEDSLGKYLAVMVEASGGLGAYTLDFFPVQRGDGEDDDDNSGRRTEKDTIERNDAHFYEHRIAPETEELEITLDGAGKADLDLYVTYDGRKPTRSQYDDKSTGMGNHESIVIGERSLDETVGVLVKSYSGSDAYKLDFYPKGEGDGDDGGNGDGDDGGDGGDDDGGNGGGDDGGGDDGGNGGGDDDGGGGDGGDDGGNGDGDSGGGDDGGNGDGDSGGGDDDGGGDDGGDGDGDDPSEDLMKLVRLVVKLISQLFG